MSAASATQPDAADMHKARKTIEDEIRILMTSRQLVPVPPPPQGPPPGQNLNPEALGQLLNARSPTQRYVVISIVSVGKDYNGT
jgi:hypothetical protein